MLTDALITDVQKFGYDIQDRTTSLTAQDTKTRERILRSLQAGCEIIRNAYPWRFRLADITTTTVTSSDYSALLPADYQAMGDKCQVHLSSTGAELSRRPLSTLRRMRLENPSTADPRMWAPMNENYLAVWPAGAGNPQLTIVGYLVACPTLVDGAGVTDDVLNDAVPERFQRTLLFDYAVIELKLYGGDDNYLPMRLQWEKRLRQFWADENLDSGLSRVPRYGRGNRIRA